MDQNKGNESNSSPAPGAGPDWEESCRRGRVSSWLKKKKVYDLVDKPGFPASAVMLE